MRTHLLITVISLFFISCGKEEIPTGKKEIPTYKIKLTVSPSEGGKLNVSPSLPMYPERSTVTITPEPNEHWVFKQWEGDGSGSSTPLQLIMDSNKSVVGVFVEKDYPLKITIEGEGTVEEKIVPNPGGRSVELTPKPKEGWVFESWGGDLTGTETPKTIKVDKEKNVTVKFKRRNYPLNITITGEGSIVTNPVGSSHPFETVVELTPKPKEGWVFESWGGDLTGTETPKTIKVDKEKNVTVKFKVSPSIFRLDANKVTCICENVKPGDKGFINGVEFEVVDNSLLRKRRDEGVNMTRLCTSLVTDMSDLFSNRNFNQPIGNWDVRNVTNMSGIFYRTPFNQTLENWDVSKVKNMSGVFMETPFNQPIGNWDVSSVTNMKNMFFRTPFNQPIRNWDVSNVIDMNQMFTDGPFNQPIGNWNVSKVQDMGGMFAGSYFNNNIGNWDVSNVISMGGMFGNNFSFNQDISRWNVSRVKYMEGMFRGANSFNQDISSWNVSNVISMEKMFKENRGFNKDLSRWIVLQVLYCNEFSYRTSEVWILPKPKFVNCNPN